MGPKVFFALGRLGAVVFATRGAMSAGRERLSLGGMVLGAGGVEPGLAAMAEGPLLPVLRGKQ